jgi:hypothetical protein
MNNAMFLLLISVGAAILWTSIAVLYIVPQKQRAKNRNMQYDPRGTIARFAMLGVMGQVLYWILAIGLLGSAARSMHSAASSNAKHAYDAAYSYQHEHPEAVMQTTVWHSTGDYPPDSLEAYSQKMIYSGGRASDEYYAIAVSENGNLCAAYWSKRPLDAENLNETTREETRRILLNPFADDKRIVGQYLPQETR